MFLFFPLTCQTLSEKFGRMTEKPTQTKLSARLPEPLCGLIREEAAKRMCSASDIVRLSLLNFFESSCQKVSDNSKRAEEVPV